MDGEVAFGVVFDVEALANLLEWVLLGQGFEFKVIEFEGRA